MAVYAYKAIGTDGLVRGSIAADTARQARDQLRARGLRVEEIRSQSPSAATHWLWGGTNRYEARLVPVIRELSTLLSAAIPLSDALRTVTKQQRGRMGNALALVCDRVSAGRSLAEAMREQPQVFDPLTIQMVEVGESAGTLDVVLDHLAEFRERYLQFKDRVLTSLFYPMFVLGMSLLVTLFLMTFVVPMLLDNLLEAGQAIPWPTRILKGVSDLLRGHGMLIAMALGGLFMALVFVLRTPWGRLRWHRLLLRLPIFGKLAEKQELARASLIIATLMESGIVFLESVGIAARAVKNQVLRQAFERVRDQVQTGSDIGDAMDRQGVFPPTVVQVFAVGQQSGKLEEMLKRLATDYDRQVTSLSTRLATVLEPILIVLLAVVVGFILFATMLPILEAGNVL
jgi:type II secretory pathway component PulF